MLVSGAGAGGGDFVVVVVSVGVGLGTPGHGYQDMIDRRGRKGAMRVARGTLLVVFIYVDRELSTSS